MVKIRLNLFKIESRFVAEFMGIDNIIVGSLINISDGYATIEKNGVKLTGNWVGEKQPAIGTDAFMAVRGEMIRRQTDSETLQEQLNIVDCRKKKTLYKGRYQETTIDSRIGELTIRDWQESIGDTTQVSWSSSACTLAPLT